MRDQACPVLFIADCFPRDVAAKNLRGEFLSIILPAAIADEKPTDRYQRDALAVKTLPHARGANGAIKVRQLLSLTPRS